MFQNKYRPKNDLLAAKRSLDALSCPEKTVRISSQDKPWITSELKSLDRKKSREYQKKGKSLKYRKLAEEFKAKYKSETDKYLKNNVDVLKDCKPGKVYKIFKRMGAQLVQLKRPHSTYLTTLDFLIKNQLRRLLFSFHQLAKSILVLMSIYYQNV